VRGGFAVAWANAGSWYLMRRRSADGPVEFAVPPFRPARALVQADGGSFWSATTGGLWRWDPDGRVSCVAPTPPVVGLFSEGSQIRLEPVSTDVMGNRSRQPEAVGWTWEPQTGKVEEVRLGPLGPRWGVSRAAGRWAAAHPSTDVVTVGTPDGVQFSLACDWPVDVAWAGDSLVVVTAHGAVLWFDGLGQLLR